MSDTTTTEINTEDQTNIETPGDNPGREAAKYRRQLRDVEAERDTLGATLTDARNAILKATLTGYSVQVDTGKGYQSTVTLAPTAIDDLALDHAELFEGATINTTRLAEIITELGTTRPHLFGHGPRAGIARREGNTATPSPRRDGWAEAFAPDGA
ncbi:hypothetical protein [uncultured Microbacterium sp.]|uniref:hypothetical protein n=1 Tax=uncultured Microbacterium sp. TaxID=191216 RepID=UPI00261A0B43|nr:hypothetical protein [uncultured Microbacterium sp.]